jgi:diguanylate cyclase (GGDEF)-like protein
VVQQALAEVAPDVPTELLLADAPDGNFRQVLFTDIDGDVGCRVGSPTDCPAARTGQTQLFRDSTRLDTCPFLRGQDVASWAVCVPVSIAGQATGVVHAQRPVTEPVPPGLDAKLQLVGRKTGDRLGVLRVLARSEAQAHVDPLTGLFNRRTLESRAHELQAHDGSFVVAFADLDHFKAINDTHGHDMGDRALRLFAKVLRDSVRPRDIPARYGGEEFVAVLPNCSLAEAKEVADRIRARLATAVKKASIPPFTVSVGLAAAEPGEAFSEIVTHADLAMLTAKTQGRDRVVVADSPPDEVAVATVGHANGNT